MTEQEQKAFQAGIYMAAAAVQNLGGGRPLSGADWQTCNLVAGFNSGIAYAVAEIYKVKPPSAEPATAALADGKAPKTEGDA